MFLLGEFKLEMVLVASLTPIKKASSVLLIQCINFLFASKITKSSKK